MSVQNVCLWGIVIPLSIPVQGSTPEQEYGLAKIGYVEAPRSQALNRNQEVWGDEVSIRKDVPEGNPSDFRLEGLS